MTLARCVPCPVGQELSFLLSKMVHNPMLPPRKRARVKAGLSSMEAIRTATYNPALFLGREKDLGTIESGKLAECWTHRGDRVNTGAILYTER
jgi:predicted amidohydrolase YtcJ